MILDFRMLRIDERELCRRMPALFERLPLLSLAGCGQEIKRFLGHELGADDRPCKPFSRPELLARVFLRRAALPRPLGRRSQAVGARFERGRSKVAVRSDFSQNQPLRHERGELSR